MTREMSTSLGSPRDVIPADRRQVKQGEQIAPPFCVMVVSFDNVDAAPAFRIACMVRAVGDIPTQPGLKLR